MARRALAGPAGGEVAKAQARAARDERLPLIGRSSPMQEVYRTLARLTAADLTVLIQGESGSGKSLAARTLHDLGRRREGRFVWLNLGAAPRERIDAELFGTGGGAAGKLAEADGGTLFLDEISDMPLDSADPPVARVRWRRAGPQSQDRPSLRCAGDRRHQP